MIQVTDETIEAGARAAYGKSAVGARTPWTALTTVTKDYFRKQIRASLEAINALESEGGAISRCPDCGEWPMKGDPHTCLRLPIKEAISDR